MSRSNSWRLLATLLNFDPQLLAAGPQPLAGGKTSNKVSNKPRKSQPLAGGSKKPSNKLRGSKKPCNKLPSKKVLQLQQPLADKSKSGPPNGIQIGVLRKLHISGLFLHGTPCKHGRARTFGGLPRWR